MRKAGILASLIVLIVILAVVRTVISNRISTSGVELGGIQDNLKQYQTQNMLLKEKIADLSSLSYIYETAQRLGFTNSPSAFTISTARPIALRQ